MLGSCRSERRWAAVYRAWRQERVPDARRGRIQHSAGALRPSVRRRATVARASNADGVSHSISAASTPSFDLRRRRAAFLDTGGDMSAASFDAPGAERDLGGGVVPGGGLPRLRVIPPAGERARPIRRPAGVLGRRHRDGVEGLRAHHHLPRAAVSAPGTDSRAGRVAAWLGDRVLRLGPARHADGSSAHSSGFFGRDRLEPRERCAASLDQEATWTLWSMSSHPGGSG